MRPTRLVVGLEEDCEGRTAMKIDMPRVTMETTRYL